MRTIERVVFGVSTSRLSRAILAVANGTLRRTSQHPRGCNNMRHMHGHACPVGSVPSGLRTTGHTCCAFPRTSGRVSDGLAAERIPNTRLRAGSPPLIAWPLRNAPRDSPDANREDSAIGSVPDCVDHAKDYRVDVIFNYGRISILP